MSRARGGWIEICAVAMMLAAVAGACSRDGQRDAVENGDDSTAGVTDLTQDTIGRPEAVFRSDTLDTLRAGDTSRAGRRIPSPRTRQPEPTPPERDSAFEPRYEMDAEGRIRRVPQ